MTAIQPLNALTLNLLAQEWQQQYLGAKLQKIQHVSRHEFVFTLWQPGLSVTQRQQQLYINLNPAHPVCFITPNTDFVEKQFERPSGLCLQLRKLLLNAKLTHCVAPLGDRLLQLTWEAVNELGEVQHLLMVLELMGKHSNMLLVSLQPSLDKPEHVQWGNILALAHSVSQDMSRQRQLGVGMPYALPPVPDKPLFWRLSLDVVLEKFEPFWDNQERFKRQLLTSTWGCDGRLIEDVFAFSANLTEFYCHLQDYGSGLDLQPCVDTTRNRFGVYRLPATTPTEIQAFDTVNEMLCAYFTTQLAVQTLAQQRQRLLNVLTLQQHKLNQQAQLLQAQKAQSEQPWLIWANLLATHTASMNQQARPTEALVSVQDWESGLIQLIPVDPQLSWRANMALMYKKAKKARVGEAHWQSRYQARLLDQETLDQFHCLVRQADDLVSLKLLAQELQDMGWLSQVVTPLGHKKQGKASKPLSKSSSKHESGLTMAGILQLKTRSGHEVWVGRTSQANAQLSGKLARGHEWWFHVHNMPGSHVLLKHACELGALSLEDIWDAANLAVYHSEGRDSPNVMVVYTQKRFVRDIPGACAGKVTYREEQSINCTVDPLLIKTLHQTRSFDL